jgi:protein-tyrosine phosphatase
MISVLFVCMGNICRSPMAEAIFRAKVQAARLGNKISIDSAGTAGYHLGERPHRGTLRELERRGVPPGDQRARQVTPADLETIDYIIALDTENLNDLRRLARAEGFDPEDVDIHLLMEFASQENAPMDVPDPYYTKGFDKVYDLIDDAATGLLQHIRQREGI